MIAYLVGRALVLSQFDGLERSAVGGGVGRVPDRPAHVVPGRRRRGDRARGGGLHLPPVRRPRRRASRRWAGGCWPGPQPALGPAPARAGDRRGQPVRDPGAVRTPVQVAVIVVGAYGLYYAVGELMRLYQPAARRRRSAPDERALLRGYSRRAAPPALAVVGAARASASPCSSPRGAAAAPRRRARRSRSGPATATPRCATGRSTRSRFPSTHNSMAAADQPGWYFAGQRYGIRRQLEAGVRGLLIDTHYGQSAGNGRVRTDLDREGTTRAKVIVRDRRDRAARRPSGSSAGSASASSRGKRRALPVPHAVRAGRDAAGRRARRL